MSKKNERLDADEEAAERKRYAGKTKSEVEAMFTAINLQSEKSAEAAGSLSGKFTNFERTQGNKRAMKIAAMIGNLADAASQQDFLRCLLGYVDALGVNNQIDLFNQEAKDAANAQSVERASKPQTGAEPQHSAAH